MSEEVEASFKWFFGNDNENYIIIPPLSFSRKINPYLEKYVNNEKSKIKQTISEKIGEYPFLKEYVGKVKGSVEASLEKLDDTEFLEKLAHTFWPFEYWSSSKYWGDYINKFSEYEKIYLGIFKKVRNLKNSNREELANEILKKVILEIIHDPYLKEDSELLKYTIERMRIGKGSTKYVNHTFEEICGYCESNIVSKPDEHTIFHEIAHDLLRQICTSYYLEKKKSFKTKFLRFFENLTDDICIFFIKKDRKTIAKYFAKINSEIRKRIALNIAIPYECSEAFAEYFADVLTNLSLGKEREYFEKWKEEYGEFDENEYKKWYNIFEKHFEGKITKNKLNKIPKLIKRHAKNTKFIPQNLYLLLQA